MKFESPDPELTSSRNDVDSVAEEVSTIDILSLNIRVLAALSAVLHPAWLGSVPRLVFALWPVPVLAPLRERFLATIVASCYLPFA